MDSLTSCPSLTTGPWSIVPYVFALLAWLICLCSSRLPNPAKVCQRVPKTSTTGDEFLSEAPETSLSRIRALQHAHESAEKLTALIETGGAGTWPPRASHGDAWPAPLQAYHDIYLTLAPLLPTTGALCNDEANASRINAFRTRMKTLLRERIDLTAVESILGPGQDRISADAWNGFFGCIAMSRHAYRWATIPVVKAAQLDKLVSFPAELDIPWTYLQKRYGVTSPGGNVTSNYFCNFTADGTLVYEINHGMSDLIKTAEYNFAYIFPAMERLALPIYEHIVAATIAFASCNIPTTLHHLRAINSRLRFPLKIYYHTLTDSRISRSIWMTHVQGFQGWGAGHHTADGEYVEYDGLSGNQLLLPMVIDAFVGLPPYLTEENMKRYVPAQQREFVDCVRKYSFRDLARERGLRDVEVQMLGIVRQMRMFRATHRSRAKPYLSVPAPERFIMTAGKSVLESATRPNLRAAFQFLDAFMLRRLKQTV